MFKKELTERLKNIFEIKKVSFDEPSDSYEQDVLFVSVSNSRERVSKDKVTARVDGILRIYTRNDKLLYGFFTKAIERAKASDKDNLFFFGEQDVQSSPARMINLQERIINFNFLFSTQYDPDKGELTSLEVECQ